MGFRRVCCFLIVVGAVLAGATAPRAAAVAIVAWQTPVTGPVVRQFEAPLGPYGAGHLGVDYAAEPGTVVRAAGPGVVAFAGVVGGAVHVVVAHDGGLRTSYSFLVAALVHRGETVAKGQPIGRAGGRGANHDGHVVHFGLRVGTTYVDPLVLFRPPDLSKIVHLAPHRDPVLDTVGHERRGLLSGLARGALHAIGSVARGVARAGVFVAGFPLALRPELMRLIALGDVAAIALLLDANSPAALVADTSRMARSLVAWWKSLRTCDHHAPPADGTGGSGNRAMVVGGMDSKRRASGASVALPVDRLGYSRGDVNYFSYSDRGGAYGPDDTHEPLETAAKQLRDQLRVMQRAQPGRAVDLIAHSQGGVVTLTFLLFFYDPTDHTLPPLNTVITLASPLRGDPLASLAVLLMRTEGGRRLLALVRHNGQSIRDLAERSNIIDAINSTRLPGQIELTTIAAAADFIVPASSAHLPGSHAVDVNPHAVSPHTALLHDPHALRAIRAALEHRAMPCESFGEAFTAAIAPTAISRIEHLGPAGEALQEISRS